MSKGGDVSHQAEKDKQYTSSNFLHKLSVEVTPCEILQQELLLMKNLARCARNGLDSKTPPFHPHQVEYWQGVRSEA